MTSPTPIRSAAPALFRSARSTRELPIVAFGVALLVAFALHAGAFLPRIDGLPGARQEAVARPAPAPAERPLACDVPGTAGATDPHC